MGREAAQNVGVGKQLPGSFVVPQERSIPRAHGAGGQLTERQGK